MNQIPPVKSESNFSDISDDTASTISSDELSISSSSPRVSFGAIHVREFERVIGDHPECKIGVPISLGWGYHQTEPVSIEQYENDQVSKFKGRMSSITRKNILHNVYGYSEEEIRRAEKEVKGIRKQQRHSDTDSKTSSKTQSVMKKVGRKFKQMLTAENFIKGLTAAAPSTMVMSMSAH